MRMQITSPRTLHQQYFKQNIMHHNSSQRLKILIWSKENYMHFKQHIKVKIHNIGAYW